LEELAVGVKAMLVLQALQTLDLVVEVVALTTRLHLRTAPREAVPPVL
jgi:hypothetical protein